MAGAASRPRLIRRNRQGLASIQTNLLAVVESPVSAGTMAEHLGVTKGRPYGWIVSTAMPAQRLGRLPKSKITVDRLAYDVLEDCCHTPIFTETWGSPEPATSSKSVCTATLSWTPMWSGTWSRNCRRAQNWRRRPSCPETSKSRPPSATASLIGPSPSPMGGCRMSTSWPSRSSCVSTRPLEGVGDALIEGARKPFVDVNLEFVVRGKCGVADSCWMDREDGVAACTI